MTAAGLCACWAIELHHACLIGSLAYQVTRDGVQHHAEVGHRVQPHRAANGLQDNRLQHRGERDGGKQAVDRV